MSELNDQPSPAEDSSLFHSLTQPGATANGGDQPQPSPQPEPQPAPPPAPGEPQPEPGPGEQHPQDPSVPTARLRVEADARRAAERRAETLQAQVEALMRFAPQPTPEPPRQRSDVFDNPSSFVQEEVEPLLSPLNQRVDQLREFYSKRDAVREFGQQTVDSAFDAVEQGLRARDPEVGTIFQRISRSMDPYGDMVRWHQQKVVYSQIGGDINGYNQRVRAEALRDPQFLAQAVAVARGEAPAVNIPAGHQPRAPNGQFVPASQSSLPSIARVGATGLHPAPQDDNTSDSQLFAETTQGRRKAPT